VERAPARLAGDALPSAGLPAAAQPSTSAAATPMAASANPPVEASAPTPPAPVAGDPSGTALHELMRRVRTDRERGA
jgi:hypothetical protein